MTASKTVIVPVLTAGLVLATAAPAAAQATWTLVPGPNTTRSNELLGAAGFDPAHMWAVGRWSTSPTARTAA